MASGKASPDPASELRRRIGNYNRVVFDPYLKHRLSRRVVHRYIPVRPWIPGIMETRRLLGYRTVFYPPSHFTGKFSRFLRAHQGVARARATAGFLDACRRYHLIPDYYPLRKSYRACQVLRMAKRAGELYVREKVRSAHRKLLARRLSPLLERLNAANGPSPGATTSDETAAEAQQVDGESSEKKEAARKPWMASSPTRYSPSLLAEYAALDLWIDRNTTPIFPLPIVRNRARAGRKRIFNKKFYGLYRTPTPPLILAQVLTEERLLSILDSIRAETRAREKQREELLRRIKHLQNRVAERREQGEEIENNANNIDNEQNRCLRSLPKFAKRAESAAVREMWRKRYLEAKKVTPRLEEECSRLRQELEKLHRELLAKVQAGVWALLTISGKTEKPSNKLSYKIMIARLLQEIEDLSRRVEGTRLKLHTEVKLRAMAEKDVRNLREELLKKKIQVTLTRNQEQATMGNGIRQQYFISAV